jgi:hypothetical protein
MTMAASTWGIPGPAFLVGYLVLVAGAVLVTMRVRVAIRRGAADSDLDNLDPRQVAFLAGGRRLARANRPAGILILLLVASACWLIASLLASPPWRTKAGDMAVLRLRARYGHLAPAHHPSYRTYDPAKAAMGVALFGASALFLLDPRFAVAAEAPWTAASDAVVSGAAGYTTGLFATGSGGGAAGYGSGGGSGGGGCGGGGCGG